MTTFTRIPDDDCPSITVDSLNVISRIEDNIYGGFTEHMGRCIYGGVYDPGSPLSNENGFRKDVIDAMRDLNVPVVRYPGGNFCATYHWLDGVGPVDQRPSRRELAWNTIETNLFGTDEFMKWCEVVGAEPYLCFNFGTGTLDEALGWLEYCNSDSNTYYANLRRENGRDRPYNVKYWALGNECWGPWQMEQLTKEDYAKKAYQWAKALKKLDPTIQLVLCGETGHSRWDAHVLSECVRVDYHEDEAEKVTTSLVDMHSIHIYTAGEGHLKNVTAPRSAERAIQIAASLIDLARIENNVPPAVRRQKICFDEWNVWDPKRATGHGLAEARYTLSDALAVAVWLNVFVRQSKYIGMANMAQSVNVVSPLMTTAAGLVKQTTWWPLWLYSKYMRGSALAVGVRAGEYVGETQPPWIRGLVETPWLDVSAARDDGGTTSLAVVNIHETRDFETQLGGVEDAYGDMVDVFTVTGASVDVVNVDGREEVGVEESKWDGGGRFVFGKHSLTILRWRQWKC